MRERQRDRDREEEYSELDRESNHTFEFDIPKQEALGCVYAYSENVVVD